MLDLPVNYKKLFFDELEPVDHKIYQIYRLHVYVEVRSEVLIPDIALVMEKVH